jgi:hypothetical protein
MAGGFLGGKNENENENKQKAPDDSGGLFAAHLSSSLNLSFCLYLCLQFFVP